MDEEMKQTLQAALERDDLWTMRKILARAGSGSTKTDATLGATPAGENDK